MRHQRIRDMLALAPAFLLVAALPQPAFATCEPVQNCKIKLYQCLKYARSPEAWRACYVAYETCKAHSCTPREGGERPEGRREGDS